MVTITNHAEQRYKERIKLPKKTQETVIQKAFNNGLSHAETIGSLNKYITHIYFQNQKENAIMFFDGFHKALIAFSHHQHSQPKTSEVELLKESLEWLVDYYKTEPEGSFPLRSLIDKLRNRIHNSLTTDSDSERGGKG